MDRQERRLRRSPFVIRDHSLNNYVQDIACRLGGKHCPDIRVHLVRTPLFNASMAPNGMMQVWTGLMLRMENEAQLAAVLGHEIAHYLERHTLERLRDIKSASAFATFVGLFGAAGAIGQLATLAATFGFSRDQERAADRIGVLLMRKAGYDPAEAAKVWGNLLAESKARPDGGGASTLPMFATHPGAEERNETLATLAAEQPGGTTNATTWRERVRPFRSDWLREEIKLGQYEESVSLFTRMIESTPRDAELLAARGEVHRRHGGDRQFDLAVADFRAAEQIGHEPPEVHRGLGMIYRRRGASREARASLKHYLELAPQAPDAPMIRSYLEELGQ
ncbi:MAG: hypothetical protein A3H32_04220 [Betaproteobacteria bacterium RIFCSPLOWO2_02_FULL_63_19]|nr:MAG: hypothetical protein A3H32_04220 [Betaproteobacteria bacterium RIFCSPLOWO2_02_FULL_63_19]